MNPYCRRAVAQGVTLARETGGTCTVITLGPPGAEDVLREAVAWGADAGLHACDPAFAGSDTLATAGALAAVLRAAGPFDLILVGRNSIDGETGQVGPELAELLDLPFRRRRPPAARRRRGLAPRARARRRHAGGGGGAAGAALRGRAPVRPLQGRPGGTGRRGADAAHPDGRRRARPGPVGGGGQPDGRRGDTPPGAGACPACPRRPGRRTGRRGRAHARRTRRLDGAPRPGAAGAG